MDPERDKEEGKIEGDNIPRKLSKVKEYRQFYAEYKQSLEKDITVPSGFEFRIQKIDPYDFFIILSRHGAGPDTTETKDAYMREKMEHIDPAEIKKAQERFKGKVSKVMSSEEGKEIMDEVLLACIIEPAVSLTSEPDKICISEIIPSDKEFIYIQVLEFSLLQKKNPTSIVPLSSPLE